jgi:hypothetical protein
MDEKCRAKPGIFFGNGVKNRRDLDAGSRD